MSGMTITGLAGLSDKLAALADNLRQGALSDAVAAGCAVIEREAKTLCPKDTGTLADSIQSTQPKVKGDTASAQVATGAGFYKGQTFYGGPVEFGHFAGSRKLGDKRKFVPAHPFMRPAYDTQKEVAAQAMAQVIAQAVEKAARS